MKKWISFLLDGSPITAEDVANRPTITSGAYYVANWDKDNHRISLKANRYFLEGEPSISDVTILLNCVAEIYRGYRKRMWKNA